MNLLSYDMANGQKFTVMTSGHLLCDYINIDLAMSCNVCIFLSTFPFITWEYSIVWMICLDLHIILFWVYFKLIFAYQCFCCIGWSFQVHPSVSWHEILKYCVYLYLIFIMNPEICGIKPVVVLIIWSTTMRSPSFLFLFFLHFLIWFVPTLYSFHFFQNT